MPPTQAGPADAQNFTLEARAAVTTPQGGESFRLRWQRHASLHRLEVFSPLGGKVAELFADGEHAQLWRDEAVPETDAGSGPLLRRLLGISLSLDQLAEWLHAEGGTRNAQGALEIGLEGWRATVEQRQGRPYRLTAEKVEAGETLRLRLVVDGYRTTSGS